jgi:hypothetical protein
LSGIGDLRPFDLVPLGDGRFELRAFSDDSEDPIGILLDSESGRRLAVALGEALVSLDLPDAQYREFRVPVGERLIRVAALPGRGVRLTVTR